MDTLPLNNPVAKRATGPIHYAHETRSFLGVDIPRVHIPVAPGRDIANVVEAAALDQKLRVLGHDAEKELDENLMALLQRGRNGSE